MPRTDSYLDILYTQYFTQLVRVSISPAYVEKRILKEMAASIRDCLLEYVATIRSKIQEVKKHNQESYLTWNTDHYLKLANQREEQLRKFENRIINLDSNNFLQEDFTFVSKEVNDICPNILPVSIVRSNLLAQYERRSCKRLGLNLGS